MLTQKLIYPKVIDKRQNVFEVDIVDATHLIFRLENAEKWASALHIAQLSDDWIQSLKNQNYITKSGRHFEIGTN